jgi:hypothetical protein
MSCSVPRSSGIVRGRFNTRRAWHHPAHEAPSPRPRRPLGGHRAVPAEGAAEAQGRPAPRPRPRRPRRHRLRAADGMPVAAAAQGARLRERHHLLAAAARLAGGRRLGEAAHEAAELAGRRGRRRLEPGEPRQPQRPGQKGGRADRPQPDGSRQARLQVPPRRRPHRHPAGGAPVGRQRPRLDATHPVGRRHPPDHRATGAAGSPAQTPGQAPRRQGLRFRAPAPRPARPRHHPPHRKTGDRVERAPGAAPLGGRAELVLASRLPPPWPPLRAAGRPAAGPAAPGLRANLPALPPPGGAREVGAR